MKTKVQKREEIEKAGKMLKANNAMVFVNFTKVPTEDVRKLRREISATGGSTIVIKKRLLNVLLKEEGIDMDVRQYDSSVGTIFSSKGMEEASSPVFKFFNGCHARPVVWIAEQQGAGFNKLQVQLYPAFPAVFEGVLAAVCEQFVYAKANGRGFVHHDLHRITAKLQFNFPLLRVGRDNAAGQDSCKA